VVTTNLRFLAALSALAKPACSLAIINWIVKFEEAKMRQELTIKKSLKILVIDDHELFLNGTEV
jgi:hypothetical protein